MRLIKTRVFVSCFVMLSAFGLAEVQWLRYHTSTNPRDELNTQGNQYYRQFENVRPEGVRCPEFKSDKPLFIKWNTPMDERGFRWIAMDRSATSGLYDLFYIDSNGNGHLDDEKPYQGRIGDQYRKTFDPIAVYFKGEDGPVTYHLACEFYSDDPQRSYLCISAGSYYEGTILIDGESVPCVLFDFNGNGAFDDKSGSYDTDRILLGSESNRQNMFLGRYLEYKDKLYRINVARDGAFVEITPAPDVAYGVVNVPANLTEFSASGINGLYTRAPKDGQLRLPEGTYRIYGWKIERNEKGQKWSLSGSDVPGDYTITVSSQSAVTVDVGEPVFSQLSVSEQKGIYSINQEFRGKLGERISIMKGSNRPPSPKVAIRSKSGEYDRTFSLEYG